MNPLPGVVVMGLFLIGGFAVFLLSVTTPREGDVTLSISIMGKTVSTETVDAADIFSGHNTTIEYGAVRCLDDVCADGTNYWRIMLNGVEASRSLNTLRFVEGDRIELRFG